MNLLSVIHWATDPEIFSIGPVHLRWYGLLFALGFILGYQILSWIFKRENEDQKSLESLTITMIISVVLGARLGHCLFYAPEFYLSNPIEILKVWEGGLASHGAAIGILIGVFLFLRKHKQITFLWLSDRMVIVIALAACFVRLGNFFNSEIFGMPTELPWAVVFERIDNIPRHPTQIYEALSYFSIFIFLLIRYLRNWQSMRPGLNTGIFMTLLFSARFLIEFVKENQSGFEEGMILNMGQILSIPLILAGISLIFYSLKRKPGEYSQKTSGTKE